ncbi:MAG: hypothetical protein WC333_01025 [Dehalococcoidia bacterium]|jgi:hypothetical protein
MATNFADSVNGNSNMQGVTSSRLLVNSTNFREALATRNLYTPGDEYSISKPSTESKMVDAINSIVNTIQPFKAYDLRNTVYGRLVTTPTPLTEIGLAMLGTQLAYNASSHISQQTLPVIKVSNLFDGNPDTKLFTKNSDYRVTTKKDPGTFANYIDRLKFWYPKDDYPFNDDPTNKDYINNTGSGQLSILFKLLNKNVFKPSKDTSKEGNIYHDKSKNIKPELTSPQTVFGGKDKKIGTGKDDKKFFIFDGIFNPYISTTVLGEIKNDSNSIVGANANMINSVVNGRDEYGEVLSDFGRNGLVGYDWSESAQNDWIGNIDTDVSKSRISWGVSQISNETNNVSQKQRGSFNDANSKDKVEVVEVRDASLTKFGVRTGLLEYTKNLVNATEGGIGDLTKKVFLNNKKLVGFNGSPLWKANDSKYAIKSETAGETGVRQHSVLDQYDRFAKAIRFLGSEHYDGNANSVTYKSVMPRIHPTIETVDNMSYVNNKNLMFSIENLAVGVFANDSKEGYAIMDDEEGTAVPLCEVGPFNGRIMWFPPYGLNIQETATARFESTMLVGRNEPIYSYQNSERSATLSFILLVDYPEQLKNYYKGSDQKKRIAEFFAFGGDPYTPKPRKKEESKVETPPTPPEPKFPPDTDMTLSFPNDEPKEGRENVIFDTMYKDMAYEVHEKCLTKNGDKTFGINQDVYVRKYIVNFPVEVSGKTMYLDTVSIPGDFTQYNNNQIEDYFGKVKLNNILLDYFSNEETRDYYEILVWGGASKLYTEKNIKDTAKGADYNLKLGHRRGLAVKKLVEERLKALFGNAVASKIVVKLNEEYYGKDLSGNKLTGTDGDRVASDENATAVAIPEEDTKKERFGKILIKRNTKPYTPPGKVKTEPTPEEQRNLTFTEGTIDETSIFVEKTINSGLMDGAEIIGKNYYQPVFHSQTPEDFHKRLTFLHQCMRQGAAKRYSTAEENGEYRARNSVFGRQPICILRVGDFYYTKVIIESLNIDYSDTTWDMNPEGFGMQPMLANVTLNIKIIGGQSLKGPIDALQNAVSAHYYANSTYSNREFYTKQIDTETKQEEYMKGILATKVQAMNNELETKNKERQAADASTAAAKAANTTNTVNNK